jgi:hypothetical protein
LQVTNKLINQSTIKAHVAELVDAADSKSAIRKGVKVRFLSWALDSQLTIKASSSWLLLFANNLQTNTILSYQTDFFQMFRMEKNFNIIKILNIPKFFGKRN